MNTSIAPEPPEGLYLFAWRGTKTHAHAYDLRDVDGMSACERVTVGRLVPAHSDLPHCGDCNLVVLRAVEHNSRAIEAMIGEFEEAFPPRSDAAGRYFAKVDADLGIGATS